MINETKSPVMENQYEALKQGLNTWRKDPNKSMAIPKQLRNLAVAMLESGVSISKLQILGLSHKQLKQWEKLFGNSRQGEQPNVTFAAAKLPMATGMQSNKTEVTDPLISKPCSADRNIENSYHDSTNAGNLSLQFKHPNGVTLEVSSSCFQYASKLIKEFVGV